MFWKKWPYWVRGGLKGLLVGLVLYLFFYLLIGGTSGCHFKMANGLRTAQCPTTLIEQVLFIDYHPKIYYVVFYIMAGAILGWFYGKIKNRKIKSHL